MSSSNSTTSPRKRCELACRPCRHRKIKCHTTNPGGPCDSCVNKGKASECEFVPVSEDYPPPRPRQSSPNTPHYPQVPRISPNRTEFANTSNSGLPSASYYHNYAPYDPTQHTPTSTHQSPSPPNTYVMPPPHGFGYPPSSPTHSMPPVSPVTGFEEYQPTGLPVPEEYLPQLSHGTHQWNSQAQMSYGGPYVASPVGWQNANQPALQMQQPDDSPQSYPNSSEQSLHYSYPSQTPQYNAGNYYPS